MGGVSPYHQTDNHHKGANMTDKTMEASLKIRAGVTGLNDIKALADDIDKAGGNTDNLRKRVKELDDAWDGLTPQEQSQRVRRLREHIQSLGNTVEEVAKNSDKLGDELLIMGKNAQKAGNQLQQTGNKAKGAGGGFNTLSKSVKGAMGKVANFKTAIATMVAGTAATQIIQLADEFASLQSRLKLATGEGIAFKTAMDGLKGIASDTASDLTATADLYGKLARSTSEMGLSQTELLGVTRSISQAMQVSGGSAESMSAALTQLAQGLSAGALRGDELNSVMEQSPRLAQALADGLGVGIGELRAMGAEGQITAEKVIAAMQSQSEVINAEFAKMPLTVGASVQVLKNNLLEFVGTLSNELNANNALADMIKQIGQGLSELDPKTIDAVKLAFSTLGQVTSDVLGLFGSVYDSISVLSSGGGEKVGLLTQTLQKLNLVMGVISDTIHGVGVAFNFFAGGMLAGLGKISQAMGAVADFFGLDFAKNLKNQGQMLIDESDKLFAKVENSLNTHQSKTLQAWQNLNKSTADILQEQADTAKAKFDDMSQAGTASSEQLQLAFAEYAEKAITANNGVIDATLERQLAEQNLQATIDETGKATITAIETAKQAMEQVKVGVFDKSELDELSESFKALGIDATEFATGISDKAGSAIKAFGEIATLAGEDVDKLALAYNGALKAVGDNATATAELETILLGVTAGNTELAQSIKKTAQAQREAKNATDDTAKAMQALGVSMQAVNAGMSKSGQETVKNLGLVLSEIKNTAKDSTALQTALSTALDTSIASAKTQDDFKAIQDEIKKAGLESSVTAHQMSQIQAGASRGAEGVKEVTKALGEQIKQADKAKQAHKALTDTQIQGHKQARQAINDNTQATANQASATKSYAGSMAGAIGAMIDKMRGQVTAMASVGVQADKLGEAYDRLARNVGKQLDFGMLFREMDRTAKTIKKQTSAMREAAAEADRWQGVLSGAGVTVGNLAKAQAALHIASSRSIGGIARLDKARLDGLRSQIDSAKRELQGMTDTAKSTADSIEQELLRAKGKETQAQEIANAQKLTELQIKLTEANARGNSDEIAHYKRAIELQSQLNTEKSKQAMAEQKARRESQNSPQNTTQAPTGQSTEQGGTQTTIKASDVADALRERIEQAEQNAVNRFAEQLIKESKRRAR